MKFLVDAQLPRRLARRLRETGHEAIHTLDLPLGNRTTDTLINDLSARETLHRRHEGRRFRELIHSQPTTHKLLLISTGNIRNAELEALFLSNHEKMVEGFDTFDYIELNQRTQIFHV